MKYGSVCSGIEAATVAWHPLGWSPAFFSEIEKFPREVLAHHYPAVPLHGDFTTIKKGDYEPIELLVGGTPCQSFSVAGLRKGLADPRGNLMLEFGSLARRLGTKWLVWENVPGVLSSNGGKDFGSFLAMLAELGYGFAYRVLDAQYFGVPQRRRRVFVVGYLGDWRRAAAVLFERHSLQGNPAPSREKGQEVAEIAGTLAANGGGLTRPAGQGNELDFCVVTSPQVASGKPTIGTLMANAGTKLWLGNQEALSGDYHILQPAYGIPGNWIGRKPENGGNAVEPMHDVAPCLTKTDRHGVAHAFKVRGGCEGGGKGYLGSDDAAFTISTNQDQHLFHNMAVRRLTPTECERLQGFPEIEKTVILYVCTDQQKQNAIVETQCLKLQSNALSAGESESKQPVKVAENYFNANQVDLEKPALLNVRIDYVQRLLQIRSQEKLLLSVSIADKQKWSRLPIQTEDFAQLAASTITWLEKEVRAGKVGSHQNINLSTVHQNGKVHVNLYGQEIDELAKDAELFTSTVQNCMKYTTSQVGQNSHCLEQALATSFCCVIAAISSFIPEQILKQSSYAISVTINTGYTQLSDNTADGPRYKALGNSMAVPVMRWIGERIEMVDNL